jgi:hypothetical protein
MNFSNIKFDINTVFKICGFVIGLMVMRNDIVQEIRSNKVFDQADKQIINYRLSELEAKCMSAVKPKEVSVPTYRPQ